MNNLYLCCLSRYNALIVCWEACDEFTFFQARSNLCFLCMSALLIIFVIHLYSLPLSFPPFLPPSLSYVKFNIFPNIDGIFCVSQLFCTTFLCKYEEQYHILYLLIMVQTNIAHRQNGKQYEGMAIAAFPARNMCNTYNVLFWSSDLNERRERQRCCLLLCVQ